MLQSVAYVALLAVNLALCRAGQNTVELLIISQTQACTIICSIPVRQEGAARVYCLQQVHEKRRPYVSSALLQAITTRMPRMASHRGPTSPALLSFPPSHDPVLGEVST